MEKDTKKRDEEHELKIEDLRAKDTTPEEQEKVKGGQGSPDDPPSDFLQG